MVKRFAKPSKMCENFAMPLQPAPNPYASPTIRLVLPKRVLTLAAMAGLVIAGLLLDIIAPSLRPAIAASGKQTARDVEEILASRSPGKRLADVLLTKVKTALGDSTGEVPDRETSGSPDTKTRSRLIPARDSEAESPSDSGPLAIEELLAPLDLLGEDNPAVPLTSIASLPANLPIVLLGPGTQAGSGGGGGVGSGASGGGTPVSDLPVVTTPSTPTVPVVVPVTPVPEPSTWLSMVVGLALTAAAMRRLRGVASLAA